MSMRVALIGNMNNNHFAMVRYLRDRGVDAELLLFNSEQAHFHPSCDTYSLDYMRYVKQLDWGLPSSLAATTGGQIRAAIKGYDVLVGCGTAPAYLNKAGVSLDIFVPYGEDIWGLTTYPRILPLPRRLAVAFLPVYHQRQGIRQCKVFHMNSNAFFEAQWKRYRGDSERWFEGMPMVHGDTYRAEYLPEMIVRSHWGRHFEEMRKGSDLLVFYHARHVWTVGASDPNAKGTDRLFKGWAMFRARHPDIKARLVTLEYGRDVPASKALIAGLGIEDSVIWMPKMYRKDLMVGLLLADIVCAEFENSFMSSGVLYEAQVGTKPILAYRNDLDYSTQYPDLYPIMNAKDPESVAARLEEYIKDPAKFKAMGAQGRRWYEEEVVEKALGRYMNYFEAVA